MVPWPMLSLVLQLPGEQAIGAPISTRLESTKMLPFGHAGSRQLSCNIDTAHQNSNQGHHLVRAIRNMLVARLTQKASVMTSVSGKTTNGFTYEGDYERENSGRVTWTATYRRRGDFFGMRHGRISPLLDIPAAEIDAAVKDDIEATWIQSD